MSSEETKSLLSVTPDLTSEEDKNKTLRVKMVIGVFILYLVTFVMTLPVSILDYIINEWTQFIVKKEYFINATISRVSCKTTNYSTEFNANLTIVQQESAKWLMLSSIANYIPGFFTSLVLTPMTDTYGRRFLLILSLFGIFLKNAFVCAIIYTNQQFGYMVASFAFEGFTGSSFSFYSICFSYIADYVMDKSKRMMCFVIMEFLTMASIMVSGLISAVLIDNFGFSVAALACTTCILSSLVTAILFLPESLKSEDRIRPVSIIESLIRPLLFYISKVFKGKRLLYILFLMAFGLAELIGLHRPSLETLYLLGMPFCFSPTWIGYFSFARHFSETFIGLGSVKFLQAFMTNEAIAILSTVSNMLSYIVEALARSELMLFMVAVFAVFAVLAIPLIRGIMSVLTPADQQVKPKIFVIKMKRAERKRALFSSLAAIQIIGMIVSVSSENTIYSVTVSVMDGFVFLVLAGLCVIQLVLLIIGAKIVQRRTSDTATINKSTDITKDTIK